MQCKSNAPSLIEHCFHLCTSQIESETVAAEEKSQETLTKVETLQVNLAGLQKKIGENEYKVAQAEDVAEDAADLANKASEVKSVIISLRTYKKLSNRLPRKFSFLDGLHEIN